MKQFGILFRYECSKVIRRRSFWITMAAVVLFYAFMEIIPITLVTTSVSTDGGEEFSESYSDKVARDREDGLRLTGRLLDDELLQEAEEYEEELAQKANRMSERELTYALNRYSLLEYVVYHLTEQNLEFVGESANPMTQQEIYDKRWQLIQAKWQGNYLSQKERAYWQEKEDALEKPIRLQHFWCYDFLILDGGLSYGFIMISFVVGVILSQIFAEEHTRKTDQLVLCSRLGRKHVYYAKILAGIVMTLAVTFFVLIMIFGFYCFFYGPEGANAVIQQQVGWYSYPLTVGQVILIMILLQVIAALLTAIIVMVLSEWLGNRIAPMVFVIMSLFVAAAVVIPRAYRIFSQIWSYLPMNLVRLEEGICDLRLVSIGGLQLTSWQFGPVVYLVLGVLLILLGRRLYCNYQVKG